MVRIAKERAARDEKEGEADKDSAAPKPDTSTHEDRVWALREHFHVLVKLQKEFVGRVRSLRYFVHVRRSPALGRRHRPADRPTVEYSPVVVFRPPVRVPPGRRSCLGRGWFGPFF